ncbi:MAG: hypothetical protein JWN82_161 [Candidatus Saccharibacteria bacterium]|nr:hypothetical protein [Candidatus Saccharibacteria bacterium]
MKKEIQKSLETIRRPLLFLAVLGMLFAALPATVLAAAVGGQVQERSVTLSDNGASGGTIASGVGSGVNVTYRVTFTAATSYTLRGVVLDFCDGTGTPIIGDASCDAPTDFNLGVTPTIDTTNYVVGASTTAGLGTGWTATSANSGQTFSMTKSAGTALTSGTTYTFAISGVTNPSAIGTFYARLLTYSSATVGIGTYAHDSPGTYQDYGGFALSTSEIVQVSAKVQEALTFCVSGLYSGAAPPNCGATATPAITLGHGTNNTLGPDVIDQQPIFTLTSTNAVNGLTIRMRSALACGGLSMDAGATCGIPAVGGGASTWSVMTAGTAAFGMYCHDGSGGTGSLNCDDNYVDRGGSADPNTFGMDTSTVGDNVTSTYGDVVAHASGPVSTMLNQYDFAATAGNTTPAGLYTTNLAMIATGSF